MNIFNSYVSLPEGMQKPSPGPPAVLPEMTSLKTHRAVIKVMFGMLRFVANVRGR